jgi:hypothetical protein
VQGWAVVDNTGGADWDNVQLSLVAGAPQSFIQPLSQPLYTRRPEIPIATEAQLTPQTHEAASMGGSGAISGTVTDQSGAVIPGATVTAIAEETGSSTTKRTNSQGRYDIRSLPAGQFKVTVNMPGFQRYEQEGISVGDDESTVDVVLNVGSVSETVTVMAAPPPVPRAKMMSRGTGRGAGLTGALGVGVGGSYGGGVYRTSDAIQQGDVSTKAFDDFFEYALTQPVTIHKNESAMVPILQQELPAEHVTLWSEKDARPLRAVWLENKSKLTLDSGSFSIFESGEFAGEGLLDPIHPGERRLLSYAADQAVRVKVGNRDIQRTLHHVQIREGAVIETYMNISSITYSATNSADLDRDVLIEHPRADSGWTLEGDLKPAETAPSLYRFRLPVAAHSTATLEVRERGPVSTTVRLTSSYNQSNYLLELVKQAPDALEKLKPVMDAQAALTDLDRRITESKAAEAAAAADEARDRENLTALKGNDAAKRFVDELNRAEDQLQATRKQTADLEQQKKAATEMLNTKIAAIGFDWDVKAK